MMLGWVHYCTWEEGVAFEFWPARVWSGHCERCITRYGVLERNSGIGLGICLTGWRKAVQHFCNWLEARGCIFHLSYKLELSHSPAFVLGRSAEFVHTLQIHFLSFLKCSRCKEENWKRKKKEFVPKKKTEKRGKRQNQWDYQVLHVAFPWGPLLLVAG